MNFRSLNQLFTQDMVTGIPILVMPDKLYEGCLVGKQSIKSFISTMPIRSSYILEVVHLDAYGPFDDHDIDGNMYFISFVDEYSRNTWIYMIRYKNEVFSIFKIFKWMG